MDFIYFYVHHLIKFITVSVILFTEVNAKYLSILLAFFFFYLILTIYQQSKYSFYLEKIRRLRDKLSSLSLHLIKLSSDLKDLNEVGDLLKSRQQQEREFNKFIAFLKFFQHLLFSVAISLIFTIGILDLMRSNITIGEVVLINAYAISFFNPVKSMGYLLEEFNKDIYDLRNILRILDYDKLRI
jgi:ATP-binding cassette subfamily B protein